MDAARFSANPEFENTTEQLADLMQLCVGEVARLQGKQAKPSPLAAARSPSKPSPAPPPAPVVVPAPLVAPTPTKSAPPPPPPVVVPVPVVVPAPVVIAAPVSAPPPPPAPVLVPDITSSAAPPAAAPANAVSYTALVRTSNASEGAFDGQVFLKLQGANGASTEVREWGRNWVNHAQNAAEQSPSPVSPQYCHEISPGIES